MSDLISRQAAIDAPEKLIKDCNPEHFVGHQKFIEYMDNAEIGSFGNWQFANGFNLGLTATEVAIMELPSAQPERKKGKWVLHPEVKNIYGGIYIECSECHTKYVVQHIEDEKYCRNCGAKMRGEANDSR